MAQASIGAKLFVQILKKSRFGSVEVVFPDLTKKTFGEGDVIAHLTIKNWKAIDEIINKGDLGLAEAIIEGDLEVDNTAALIEWACRNDQSLGQALHGTLLGTFLYKIKNVLKRNSKVQAKKNIMAHYDLGNDFYKLWLDDTMTYSSGIFTKTDESLKQAQLNKYDRMIEQLNLKSGDHILEIGCGWGGFFSRAVERTGCKVTAVMNSPNQARHNRQMIQEKGFKSHVDLQEIDYRDIQGKYDKVVSIEMIEAVGRDYWPAYFQAIARLLKPGGRACIQSIVIDDALFDRYAQSTDFIQQYIFPGGFLPSRATFVAQAQAAGLQVMDTLAFGQDYAETLQRWRKAFVSQQEHLSALGFDRRFERTWLFYLAYCEAAFAEHNTDVVQFTLRKPA